MNKKHTCMECGMEVIDGINGYAQFLEEENHVECLCNACECAFPAMTENP